MIVARSISRIRGIIQPVKRKGKVIGFVPTMGALHEGHLSLVRAAKKQTDYVVVSIFVNPTQFGPGEDFRKYPRTFSRDRRLLEKERVNLLFYPSTKTMYTEDFSTYVEETSLSKYLCGKSRPGHFRGVCTVVTKLFNIIQPDVAYFGQKDYQQAQIIKRMVGDLNFPIRIKVMPIVRHKDGLAMSSRNQYLKGKERSNAVILYRALLKGKQMIKDGIKNTSFIRREMVAFIKRAYPSCRIDYVSIVDADTLEDVRTVRRRVLIALAVYIGSARLIDNMLVSGKKRKINDRQEN